jgi:hypothetical protein
MCINIDMKEIGCRLDSPGLEKGPVADSCEHSNESSAASREFLDQLSDYSLLTLFYGLNGVIVVAVLSIVVFSLKTSITFNH